MPDQRFKIHKNLRNTIPEYFAFHFLIPVLCTNSTRRLHFLYSRGMLCLFRHFICKKNAHWGIQSNIINNLLNLALRKLGDPVAFPVKCRTADMKLRTHFFNCDAPGLHFIFQFIFIQSDPSPFVSFMTLLIYHISQKLSIYNCT